MSETADNVTDGVSVYVLSIVHQNTSYWVTELVPDHFILIIIQFGSLYLLERLVKVGSIKGYYKMI